MMISIMALIKVQSDMQTSDGDSNYLWDGYADSITGNRIYRIISMVLYN